MPGRSKATSEVIGAFGLGPRQCLGAKFGDLETEASTRQTHPYLEYRGIESANVGTRIEASNRMNFKKLATAL